MSYFYMIYHDHDNMLIMNMLNQRDLFYLYYYYDGDDDLVYFYNIYYYYHDIIMMAIKEKLKLLIQAS